MKKLLCYLGIVILFSLAITPYVLRIALPDKDKIEKKNENMKLVLLSCSSNDYMTVTNYTGDKINRIMIKKIKKVDNENVEEQEKTSTTNYLDSYFNEFALSGDVVHNEVADGEILTIDFSVSEHSNLNIGNLTNSPEKQKNIYESQGLTCTIDK